tara:strand:+ start:217 stop:813 length:597 start_codon:yes stop_codon:yes gene_type:complete
MEILLQTDKSFIGVYKNVICKNVICKEELHNCVLEIQDKLLDYPKIRIYNKDAIQHRCIGFFSNESIGYYYSGQLAKSQPLSENIKKLLENINSEFNSKFNGILINKYNDGNDYIGRHSDNEKGLDDKIGVLTLSYGAVRKFRIRNKKDNKIVIDIPLEPYEIVHMGGNFQKEFTHEIPIEKKVKDCRYSFTFRKHIK